MWLNVWADTSEGDYHTLDVEIWSDAWDVDPEAEESDDVVTDNVEIEVSSYWFCVVLMDMSNYTYTLNYDGNGADGGEMDPISVTNGEEYTLTTNTFTRTGYTFTGWNTEADGSGTSYEDEATVSNLTTEDGATITLYAQWEEIPLISIPVTKLSLEDTSTVLSGVEFSLFELICEDDTHDHISDDDLIDVNDYDTSCWKLIGTYTSDELGEFTLEDLDITKEYRLVETKTVGGYLVPEGQWTISFSGFEIQISTSLEVAGIAASTSDEFTIVYSIECEDGTYLNLCSDEDGEYDIDGYSEDEILSDEIVLSYGGTNEYEFYIRDIPSGTYTVHVMGIDSDEYVALCDIDVQVGTDDDGELVSAGTYMIETDITATKSFSTSSGTEDSSTGIEINDYDIATTMTESFSPVYVLEYSLEDILTIRSVGNPPAVTLSDETLYIYNGSSYDLPTTGAMGIEDYITIGAVIILVGFIGKIHKSKRTVGLRSSRIKVSRAEARNIKKISKLQKRCRKMQKKTEKMLKK